MSRRPWPAVLRDALRAGRRGVHALAAPYALDALGPREHRRFERHLRRCPDCAAELRVLTEDATWLARAAARPAPDGLRARVLTAALATPQEADVPRPAAPVPVAGKPSGTDAARLWGVSLPARYGIRVAATVTALSLAVSAVLALQLARTDTELDRQRAVTQSVNAVLAAPDALAVSGRPIGGRSLSAVESAAMNQAVVNAAGLPPPPEGRAYQLWRMRAGPATARPAGMLSYDLRTRTAGPAVVRDLRHGGTGHADRLAVTLEPAGGSARPTTSVLIQLALG
ncbi:anti-sigma factor domain-containing protein [Streptomyces sp. NPDC059788]|uniref:anti-sigma factor n=1 Tax=Streptomyces sp. NPDC059788 TaxID=3346948 RepID=UPI0036474523